MSKAPHNDKANHAPAKQDSAPMNRSTDTAGNAFSTPEKDGTTEAQKEAKSDASRQAQSPREKAMSREESERKDYEQRIADAKKWMADNKDDVEGVKRKELEIGEYERRLIDLEVAKL